MHDAADRVTVNDRAEALFTRCFGAVPAGVTTAPGRVNLLGDHTDYSGGLVLPAALRLQTAIAYRRLEGSTVRAVSESAEDEARFVVGEEGVTGWAAYLAGVAWALEQDGHAPSGLELAVASEVPTGAGLSSSAALEVAAARVWRAQDALDLSDTTLALLCQRAENRYVGVPCGVMDQFAASVPAPGQAIRLDCRDLRYRVLRIPPDWSFVVVDSGASRRLAGSAYAARVRECASIAERLGLAALRDLKLEHLRALSGDLRKRARHVLYENSRVEEGAAAMAGGEIKRFGTLMSDSHLSLREDYEVSSEALDRLVRAASSFAGCYGSRLTGAGFGGCTVNLVAGGQEGAFAEHLRAHYPQGKVVAVV
jgi:galactokinase